MSLMATRAHCLLMETMSSNGFFLKPVLTRNVRTLILKYLKYRSATVLPRVQLPVTTL